MAFRLCLSALFLSFMLQNILFPLNMSTASGFLHLLLRACEVIYFIVLNNLLLREFVCNFHIWITDRWEISSHTLSLTIWKPFCGGSASILHIQFETNWLSRLFRFQSYAHFHCKLTGHRVDSNCWYSYLVSAYSKLDSVYS